MPKRSLNDSDTESDSADNVTQEPEGTKRTALVKQSASETSHDEPILTCNLPPRCQVKPRPFHSITAFEAHYERYHSNVCTTCQARLPTPFFLDLHIQESHDPLFQSLLSGYPGRSLYRCFVETCENKSPSISSRRRHLIGAHAFPEAYRFNVVTRGIPKHAQSLLFPSSDSNRPKGRVPDKVEGKTSQAETEVVLDEQKPNRAQRRAQARESSQPKTAIADDDEVVDPRAAHARAVEDLFKSIEVDPDALEPEAPSTDEQDVNMDELADVMQKTRLVPKQIQFGRKH